MWGTICGSNRLCHTTAARISSGRESSSDSAMMPPWLKPPTTTCSGATPNWLAAEGKACASKARLCASCASLMVRSPLGSMEKSNHANAPGPMRNGARRLST